MVCVLFAGPPLLSEAWPAADHLLVASERQGLYWQIVPVIWGRCVRCVPDPDPLWKTCLLKANQDRPDRILSCLSINLLIDFDMILYFFLTCPSLQVLESNSPDADAVRVAATEILAGCEADLRSIAGGRGGNLRLWRWSYNIQAHFLLNVERQVSPSKIMCCIVSFIKV